MACNLALESPESVIGVEDAISKEFFEDVVEARAFDVVWEVGVKEVLDVCGVGGADSMGEVKEGTDSESGRWGLGEHLGDPIVEAVAVAEEADEVSNYGV